MKLEEEAEAAREASQKEFREVARRKVVENAMLEQQLVRQLATLPCPPIGSLTSSSHQEYATALADYGERRNHGRIRTH